LDEIHVRCGRDAPDNQNDLRSGGATQPGGDCKRLCTTFTDCAGPRSSICDDCALSQRLRSLYDLFGPRRQSTFQHALQRCRRGRFSWIFPPIGQCALIPSIICSSMSAVVTPGKSDPRIAVASESPRRMRSWAGFPITVWSRSLIAIFTRPLASATGPKFPRAREAKGVGRQVGNRVRFHRYSVESLHTHLKLLVDQNKLSVVDNCFFGCDQSLGCFRSWRRKLGRQSFWLLQRNTYDCHRGKFGPYFAGHVQYDLLRRG
jgi:hypothetical protein